MRRYSAYSPSPLARRTPASRYNRHGDSFLDNDDDDNNDDDHGHDEPLTSRPKTTRRRIVKGVKGLTPTNLRGGRGPRGFEREPAATATTTPRPTSTTPARIGRSRSRSPSRVPPDENDAGNSRRGRAVGKVRALTAASAGGVQKAKGGHQKHRWLVDENEEQSEITISSSSSDFESDTSSSDESEAGTFTRRQPPPAAEDFGILANQFVHLLKSSMSQGCSTEGGTSSNRNSTKQLMSRKQRKMVSRKKKNKKKKTTLESYDDESSSTSSSSDEALEYAKQVIKKRLSKSTEGRALGTKSRPRRLNQLRVSTIHTEEEEQTEVPDDGHSHNPSREGRRNCTPHYKLSSRNFEDEVAEFDAPPHEPLRARSSDRHTDHHRHPISRRSFNESVRVDDEHFHTSRSQSSNNMRHRCHSRHSRFVDGMRVPDVPEVFDDHTIETKPTQDDGYTVAIAVESVPSAIQRGGIKGSFSGRPMMPLVEYHSLSDSFGLGRRMNSSYGDRPHCSLPDMPGRRDGIGGIMSPVQRQRSGHLRQYATHGDHSQTARRIQFVPIPPGKIDFVLIDTPAGPKVSWAGFASSVQAGDYIVGIEGRDTRGLNSLVTTKLLNDKKRKSRVVAVRRVDSGENEI